MTACDLYEKLMRFILICHLTVSDSTYVEKMAVFVWFEYVIWSWIWHYMTACMICKSIWQYIITYVRYENAIWLQMAVLFELFGNIVTVWLAKEVHDCQIYCTTRICIVYNWFTVSVLVLKKACMNVIVNYLVREKMLGGSLHCSPPCKTFDKDNMCVCKTVQCLYPV